VADLSWLSDAQWAVIEPFMPRNYASAVALAAIIAVWC
jgi:hypothetical protein